MLSLFPEAEITASETNGPMIADVLPTFLPPRQYPMWRKHWRYIYHGEQRKEEEPA